MVASLLLQVVGRTLRKCTIRENHPGTEMSKNVLSADLLEEIGYPDVRKYPSINLGLLFRIGSAFRMPDTRGIDIASHV